jgi:hypothetical protein
MSKFVKVGLLICATSGLATSCFAADPRCSAPPYGGPDQAFKSFVTHFGQYVTPTKFLPAICEVKFGAADRTPMYNLGLTDRDIDGKDVADLWVDVLTALRRRAIQATPKEQN